MGKTLLSVKSTLVVPGTTDDSRARVICNSERIKVIAGIACGSFSCLGCVAFFGIISSLLDQSIDSCAVAYTSDTPSPSVLTACTTSTLYDPCQETQIPCGEDVTVMVHDPYILFTITSAKRDELINANEATCQPVNNSLKGKWETLQCAAGKRMTINNYCPTTEGNSLFPINTNTPQDITIFLDPSSPACR